MAMFSRAYPFPAATLTSTTIRSFLALLATAHACRLYRLASGAASSSGGRTGRSAAALTLPDVWPPAAATAAAVKQGADMQTPR
jgi:hypothetical protein